MNSRKGDKDKDPGPGSDNKVPLVDNKTMAVETKTVTLLTLVFLVLCSQNWQVFPDGQRKTIIFSPILLGSQWSQQKFEAKKSKCTHTHT